MSWTKQQFIEQAYEELGLASYVFDLQPEQIQSAARRMDAMVAEWDAVGVRIGYQRGGDVSEDSGVPDHAALCVYINLACLLAPSLGKFVGPELNARAQGSLQNLLRDSVMPGTQQLRGGLPLGAGNRTSRYGSSPEANPLPFLES